MAYNTTALNDLTSAITESFSGATPNYGLGGLITSWNQPNLGQAEQYAEMGNYANQYGVNPSSGSNTGYNLSSSYGTVPSTSGTGTSSGAFSLNPTPTNGSGTTFGMVPGAIGAPDSIWEQTQAIPGMKTATAQNVGNINSELLGQLSPGTTEGLQDAAAARGQSLGQGGNTGLVNETLLKTLGLTKEQLEQAGGQNYNQFLSTSGSQQQNPALMSEIASRNAEMAAAPDPTLAAEEAISLGQGSGGGFSSGKGGGGGGSYRYSTPSGTSNYSTQLQQLLSQLTNQSPETGTSSWGQGTNLGQGTDYGTSSTGDGISYQDALGGYGGSSSGVVWDEDSQSYVAA